MSVGITLLFDHSNESNHTILLSCTAYGAVRVCSNFKTQGEPPSLSNSVEKGLVNNNSPKSFSLHCGKYMTGDYFTINIHIKSYLCIHSELQ